MNMHSALFAECALGTVEGVTLSSEDGLMAVDDVEIKEVKREADVREGGMVL